MATTARRFENLTHKRNHPTNRLLYWVNPGFDCLEFFGAHHRTKGGLDLESDLDGDVPDFVISGT